MAGKLLSGKVFDIQRFSIHDGDGIRTTVFMKGCSLHCGWCQNPEGINFGENLLYFENRCIHCENCLRIDVDGYIRKIDGRLFFDRNRCKNWSKYINACPACALRSDSKIYTIAELMAEIRKDKPFYRYEGGVTISGGEPLLQAEFVLALLKACRDEEIHTAIESAVNVSQESLVSVLPFLNLIFVDFKIFDNDTHVKVTGHSNLRIKENIRFLLESEMKTKVIVRTPMVPGFTDNEENISSIGRFISEIYPEVQYELLNFNPLAAAKYKLMDQQYCFDINPEMFTEKQMSAFRDVARNNGIRHIIPG